MIIDVGDRASMEGLYYISVSLSNVCITSSPASYRQERIFEGSK